MSRFRGQFSHNMDSKGRISIPAKFRDVLRKHYDEQLVVALGQGFLVAYPREEWAKMEDSIRQMPPFSNHVELYKRHFLSTAQDCVIDPQGRILVPPELRERAGLKEKILYVGMIEYFEIWDRNAYLAQSAPMMEKMSEIKQQLYRESRRSRFEQEPR